jgi:hypothetical protein
MWKCEVVAYFKVLFHYLPGGSEEKYKNMSGRVGSFCNENSCCGLLG